MVAALRRDLAEALLYRFLATLRRDVPLEESVGDLEWLGVHREPYEDLCDRLGLSGLRSRPHHWAAL